MAGLAAILAASAVAFVLARWLEAPVVPLLVAVGFATAHLLPVPAGQLEDLLLLGAVVLLFVAGLELEPGRIRAQRRVALRVGLVQFAVLAVLGYGLSGWLGFSPAEAGYLALALTASSTLVGVRILKRRQGMFDPYGRVVLGVLLLQDVLVLLLIPLATRLGPAGGAPLETLGAVALLGGASAAVRRWCAPWLERVADEEALLLGPLALLFLFLGAAQLLDLPLIVGAFLAGVALSRFPVNGLIRAEVGSIGDFFSAIFFTALGALISVPSPTELLQAAALAALVLVVTPPLVTAVGERYGLSTKSALEAGLLLSQTSEISLVIGLAGMAQGVLDPGALTVIAMVTAGTMLLTPLIATPASVDRLVRLHPSRWRRTSGARIPRDHVVLLGCGEMGRQLLDRSELAGRELVVIDQDPAVVGGLRGSPVRPMEGDADDPETLAAAGVGRAELVISTLPRTTANGPLLEMIGPGTEALVRVFTEEDADWVRRRGGTPVLLAEGAAGALLEWYEANDERLRRDLAGRLSGRPGDAAR